jgi:osmotically-inducible protein OsmY
MNSLNRYLIPVLVAGSAVFAGCTREQQGEVRQAGRDAGAATERVAGAAADKAKDAAITAQVKTALVAEPSLSALSVDVDTTAGKVTLRGTAPDAAARDRAAQLARGIEGVGTVENQLLIQPNR